MEAVNSKADSIPGRLDKYGWKEVTGGAVRVMVLAVVLFSSAGTWSWPAAWAYVLISVGYFIFGTVLLVRVNPEVLNVRGRKPVDVPRFDRIILPLWMVSQLIGLVLAGLDAGRMHWSEVPLVLSAVGVLSVVGGGALVVWSMAANAHFEKTVRIQNDRGHLVCSSGPYRLVRHPGYAGIILAAFGVPLLLGSWVALIPGLVNASLFVLRTRIEDRIILAQLPGYAEYAAKTRYRLAPGVW